ncbi:uroporphyrinogen-III synthase [Novosphingobium tardum]|uniref:Uroporphyrinogen-III synthase n=1 Tax=Novosphingobium tardum TaxID=1538021 RepID=A0ABV8RN92_9SPHN
MSARPFVVVRPEPGNRATLAAAEALGLEAAGFPLFSVEPVAWNADGLDACDALLLGSANALRHGGEGLRGLSTLPVYAVGEETAAAARAAGFEVAHTGRGGLQSCLAPAQRDGRRHALRLAGEAHVALAPVPGLNVTTRVVYRVRPLPLPADAARLFSAGAVVALHSGEAAVHFAREVDRLGLRRQEIALACLAPRVADAAGPGWRQVAVAPEPRDVSLLAMARELCQTPRQGS